MADDTPPPGAVDARFTLAAERTVLAWVRTSIGLIAAGVAILHLFGSFSPTARLILGTTVIALGAFTAVVGVVRWREVDRALNRGGAMPGPWPVYVLVGTLLCVAVGFAIWR
ncbi:MAG: DUF202 domain-containing protein [Gordonia sp. (in: high G+C Gram-positive bacteria)]|uniref:YidH family protein n=1 Tax=Gordonia sp. (in: high G+C Gram-positive bacteria) TaxID=84139 RepID=UPI0039E6D57F